MFARFDKNPAMTLQDIKETKHYGRTHRRTDAHTDNMKTVYPPQTKFAGGIKTILQKGENLMKNKSLFNSNNNKCHIRDSNLQQRS